MTRKRKEEGVLKHREMVMGGRGNVAAVACSFQGLAVGWPAAPCHFFDVQQNPEAEPSLETARVRSCSPDSAMLWGHRLQSPYLPWSDERRPCWEGIRPI